LNYLLINQLKRRLVEVVNHG